MEANKSDLNRTGEAHLQEVDSFHLLHPEIYQGGGITKKTNVSSCSSESSQENLIEIVTGIEYGNPSELNNDEVHKDEILDDSSDGDHIISLFDIPAIQVMEHDYNPDRIPESVFASAEAMAASAEWSATSNESLFSIHPNTFSYGGDQPLFLAPEMHIQKELQASVDDKNVEEEMKLEEKEHDEPLLPIPKMNREKDTIEHGDDDKNVGEEMKLEEKEPDEPPIEKESEAYIEAGDDKYVVQETKMEEKEPSQVKTKQSNERILNLGHDEARLPSGAMLLLNHSPRSDGSDGSDYSFAFPILASNAIQKGDGLSSRRGVSGGYNHGLESSIARRQEQPQQHQQQQQPLQHKRECWCCCCCFPLLSCIRCCFGSCRSCCNVQSCFSCCNFPSCYSCCNRFSCKKFFCLCCWPCR